MRILSNHELTTRKKVNKNENIGKNMENTKYISCSCKSEQFQVIYLFHVYYVHEITDNVFTRKFVDRVRTRRFNPRRLFAYFRLVSVR